MTAIPLGLVTSATGGTDQALSLTAAQAKVASTGLVKKIEVWPVPASTGEVSVRAGGVVIAKFAATPNPVIPWKACANEGNTLDPAKFAINPANNNEGAYVTLWVE